MVNPDFFFVFDSNISIYSVNAITGEIYQMVKLVTVLFSCLLPLANLLRTAYTKNNLFTVFKH